MDKWANKLGELVDRAVHWFDSSVSTLDDGEGNTANIWKTTIFIGVVGTITFHFVVTTILLIADMRSPHAPMVEDTAIEFDFTDAESDIGKDQYVTEDELAEQEPERERLNFQQLMESYDQRSEQIKASPEMERKIREKLEQEIEAEKTHDWQQERQKEPERQQTKQEQQKPEPKEINKGPADIAVNMKDRRLIQRPPNPVYLCRGHGKVTLIVKVNPAGKVVSAEVSPHGTNTTSTCTHEYAQKAALQARFNEKADAPRPQTGSMTFTFAAQ